MSKNQAGINMKKHKQLNLMLSDHLRGELLSAMKVIEASPASRGKPASFPDTVRQCAELGALVIQFYGDGFVSPFHAMEQIKKAMEVN